jgi:methyltransferase (TIGR00027 family)
MRAEVNEPIPRNEPKSQGATLTPVEVDVMREEQPSQTALSVCFIRTVHQMIDEIPHILEDPVSPLLLDQEAVRRIETKPEAQRSLQARALRSHVVLRSRYSEDRLFLAFKAGIRQFISLGAGYDTFSFRQPGWADSMRIVETDHFATQFAKRKLLEEKGIESPENVEFIPLDFEKEGVRMGLSRSKLDFSLPTFVSCLGVLAYLTSETVRRVFQSIAGMPPGSRLVLAFAPKKNPSESDPEDPSASQRAAEHGEPWLTRFEVAELQEALLESGFSKVSFLETGEAKAQYYVGRQDLPPPSLIRLCEAVV